MTAPAEGDAAMSFDAQSVANNENLKDLHIKASFSNGTQDLQANDVAHLKNQLPAMNGSTSPSDAKPQVMDINLPTPTDSAVESTAPAADSAIAASDFVPAATDAATSQPQSNGTAETTAMDTDLPPSAPVSALLEDPAVQPPVSDARDPPEPVSQEQAAQIQAQKEAADPVQAAVASESTVLTLQDAPSAPEPAVDALPVQAEAEAEAEAEPEAIAPAATSGSMETDKPAISAPAESTPALDLPHHPSLPTATSGLPEKSGEAIPVPGADAPAEVKSGAQLEVKTEVASTTAALPPPAQDAEMKDAPPSSPSKLSRSREDDSGLDEPEAKRMRPSSAAGSAIAAASPVNPASPASQSAQEDRDFTSPMSEPQSRAIQAVIANTKRNGHSTNFASPVDHVALNIPTYPEIIKNPMDLGTMHEKAKNKEYPNVQAFVDDFNLIVSNCEKFNGTVHVVTTHVYKLRETFDKQMRKVPGADFVEPPPVDKKRKNPAPPRQPARRETRVAAQPKTPVAASPSAPSFALNPDGMPLIRRDSTAVDGGRPKREIHPPAPKDLPYSARPKKKKFQIELRFCNTVLHELDKAKYAATAGPFKTPVDPVALNIPTYHKIIKKPMDLSTMRRKLDGGMYENAKEFDQDMTLIFSNCYKFNKPGEWVYNCGKNLESEYKAEWAKKDDYVRQNAPDAAAQSASSPEVESDEDEDDEEDEDEDEESTKIAKIQAQMAAMNEQLAALKKGKAKKKTPPAASKKKSAKGAKKVKKEDKKSSKKSKSSVPYVSYEQKQDISNRINTLPESRMMQALDIIKNNMPQLKGAADDELELDIDELSNDVLYKLLQFVRKYAPRAEDDQTERRQSYAPTQPSKPKKNKPMGAKEQESRIEALRRMQSGEAADLDVKEESSDDEEESDDESEEE